MPRVRAVDALLLALLAVPLLYALNLLALRVLWFWREYSVQQQEWERHVANARLCDEDPRMERQLSHVCREARAFLAQGAALRAVEHVLHRTHSCGEIGCLELVVAVLTSWPGFVFVATAALALVWRLFRSWDERAAPPPLRWYHHGDGRKKGEEESAWLQLTDARVHEE